MMMIEYFGLTNDSEQAFALAHTNNYALQDLLLSVAKKINKHFSNKWINAVLSKPISIDIVSPNKVLVYINYGTLNSYLVAGKQFGMNLQYLFDIRVKL